jgi:hypothetical protein
VPKRGVDDLKVIVMGTVKGGSDGKWTATRAGK